MKYLSINTIFESWKQVLKMSELNRSPLNKFFGFIQLLRHIDLVEGLSIEDNVQYKIVPKELSQSLQSLYYFGNDSRTSTSEDVLHIIFPNHWQQSVFNIFLKSKVLPIEAVAAVCMQNVAFENNAETSDVVSGFKDLYHISEKEETFFEPTSLGLIEFTDTLVNRHELFELIKEFLGTSDNLKFTVGFTKNLYDKKPGELTAGPFIQPLYSGQENLRCVLMANFDLKVYYKISSQPVSAKVALNKLKSIPRNKIIYGAPGTGKSYELRLQAESLGFADAYSIRLTFHPNYSYQQFVGTYKPTPIYKTLSLAEGTEIYGTDKKNKLDDQKEPVIDYSFVPGPFLNQLVNAIKNPGNDYLLIIEEINRASVSAVFGDVFQLLDRNEDGESEYSIEFNKDISNYLASQSISPTQIKIPANLFIWATMNSADQGVMPLDAAFKRRWSFEYLAIDEKENEVSDRTIIFQDEIYSWNKFRKDLNTKLKAVQVPEDKLLGPFFLNKIELADNSAIKNKLLLYLRDDVVRHNPETLFRQKTFSDIISAYSSKEEIFVGLNPANWKQETSPEPEIIDESLNQA